MPFTTSLLDPYLPGACPLPGKGARLQMPVGPDLTSAEFFLGLALESGKAEKVPGSGIALSESDIESLGTHQTHTITERIVVPLPEGGPGVRLVHLLVFRDHSLLLGLATPGDMLTCLPFSLLTRAFGIFRRDCQDAVLGAMSHKNRELLFSELDAWTQSMSRLKPDICVSGIPVPGSEETTFVPYYMSTRLVSEAEVEEMEHFLIMVTGCLIARLDPRRLRITSISIGVRKLKRDGTILDPSIQAGFLPIASSVANQRRADGLLRSFITAVLQDPEFPVPPHRQVVRTATRLNSANYIVNGTLAYCRSEADPATVLSGHTYLAWLPLVERLIDRHLSPELALLKGAGLQAA